MDGTHPHGNSIYFFPVIDWLEFPLQYEINCAKARHCTALEQAICIKMYQIHVFENK